MDNMENLAVKIFKSTNIITMNGPAITGFATLGEYVIATGRAENLIAMYPNAVVYDFGENSIVPGFNDSHIHLAVGAEQMQYIDMSPREVRSIHDIKKLVAAEIGRAEPGAWVCGAFYDDGKMSDGRILSRADLDEVAPDHPVLIFHVACHWGVANSRALALGNIDNNSKPPEGGEFGRDPSGYLNGILYERALHNFAYPQSSLTGTSVKPQPTLDERLSGLSKAVRSFHSAGLTSVCDALVGPSDLSLFQEGARRGILTLRVNMLITAEKYGLLEEAGIHQPFGDRKLRVTGIKTLVDGAVGGRTCFMDEPFEGTSDDFGIQTTSTSDLRDIIFRGHERGIPVCVHANGDRAIKIALELFEEAQTWKRKENLRHRIEHCSIVNDDLIEKLKKLNITVTPFGSYVNYHGSNLLKWYGDDRVKRMFAHKWFLESQIPVAGSSDFPCGPYEPLLGIQSCVTRQGFDGASVGANQKISVEQALWLYTVGSAAASGDEHWKGRIAPGFVADFVVLGQNPFKVPEAELAKIPVLETWVGAGQVWKRSADDKLTGLEVHHH